MFSTSVPTTNANENLSTASIGNQSSGTAMDTRGQGVAAESGIAFGPITTKGGNITAAPTPAKPAAKSKTAKAPTAKSSAAAAPASGGSGNVTETAIQTTTDPLAFAAIQNIADTAITANTITAKNNADVASGAITAGQNLAAIAIPTVTGQALLANETPASTGSGLSSNKMMLIVGAAGILVTLFLFRDKL